MKFREIRSTYPKPTNRVFVPNSPRKLEPVKLALRLQRLTMSRLIKAGRRLIKNFLREKRLDNEQAMKYLGARLKQVSAEYRFRVTKKTP